MLRSSAVAIGLFVLSGMGNPREDTYLFYVASESDDVVTLVRFAPSTGLSIEKVIHVGWYPAEIEAPHGVFVSPSGDEWYLTLGHGFPFGQMVKYKTGSDTVVSFIELGMFPATISVPRFGGIAFAVNSDFHGDHVPSTVSIIDLATMTEVERTETCTMPHGSRFSADGLKHYSACMMDDQLVEISIHDLNVARRMDLVTGRAPMSMDHGERSPCSPTWAAPHPGGQFVYVACNKGDEVVEVDVDAWEVTRRFPAPGSPYNADVSPDGNRLVVTQKGSGEVLVFDLSNGEQIAAVKSTRRVTHGVVISPDSRYAFTTVEGIGGEPGTVDVIDLLTLEKVSTIDVGKQAGGIAFWKTETR